MRSIQAFTNEVDEMQIAIEDLSAPLDGIAGTDSHCLIVAEGGFDVVAQGICRVTVTSIGGV